MAEIDVDREQLRRFASRFLEVAKACECVPATPPEGHAGRSSGEAELALRRVGEALGRCAAGLEGLARNVLNPSTPTTRSMRRSRRDCGG